MRQQGPHIEDKLLDFAYGELPPPEREEVQSHLQACPACSEALDSIQGVRRVMSRLPQETAPETGLDSLLGYAQQAARRASAGPAPKRGIRAWLIPALGLGAVGVVAALIATNVKRDVPLEGMMARSAAPVVDSAPPAPAAPAGAPATKTAHADKILGNFGGAPAEGDLDEPAQPLADDLALGSDQRKAPEHRPVTGSLAANKPSPHVVTATPLRALGERGHAGANEDAKAIGQGSIAAGPEQKRLAPEGGRWDRERDADTGGGLAKEAPPKDAEKQEFATDLQRQGGAPQLQAPAGAGGLSDRAKSGSKGFAGGGYARSETAPQPAPKAPQLEAKDESSMSNAIVVAPSTPPAATAAPPAPPPARNVEVAEHHSRQAARAEPAPEPIVAEREEAKKKSDSADDSTGETRFQSLDRRARQMHAQNDWSGEELALRQALGQPEASVPDTKGDLLSRLCEAQDNQGKAGSACQRISAEFPNSRWNAALKSRRRAVMQMDAAESASPAAAKSAPAKASKATEKNAAPASSDAVK